MPWIELESGAGDRVGSGVDGICVGLLGKLHADRKVPINNPTTMRNMPLDIVCGMLEPLDPRR